MIKMVSIKRSNQSASAPKEKTPAQAPEPNSVPKKSNSRSKNMASTKRTVRKSAQKVAKKATKKAVKRKVVAKKTATRRTTKKAVKRRTLMTVGARKVKKTKKATVKSVAKKVARKRTTKKATVKKSAAKKVTRKRTVKKTTAKKTAAKKVTRKRTARKATSKKRTVGRTPVARKPKRVAKKATNKKAAKKVTRKRTARKATAKKRVVKRTTVKKRTARKTTAKKRVAKKVTRKRTAKKRTAKKRVAKKVTRKRTAKKRVAKKSTAKKRTARKKVTRKRTSKKRTAKKTVAKKRTRKRTARKTTRKRTSKKRTARKRTTRKRAARKVTRRRRRTVGKRKRSSLSRRGYMARKASRRSSKRRRTVGKHKRSSLSRRGYMARKPSVRVRRNRSSVSGLRWPVKASSWKELLGSALPVVGGAVAPNALWGLVKKLLDLLIPGVGQGLGLGGWLATQPKYILALENLLLAYFAHSLRGARDSFWNKANDGLAIGLLLKAFIQLADSLSGGQLGHALGINIERPLTVGSWPLISAEELAVRKVDLDVALSEVLDQLAGVDYSLLNEDQKALYEAVQVNAGEASSRSDLISVSIDSRNLAKASAAWSDARTSLAVAQSMLAGLLAVGPIQQAAAQQLVQQAQQMALQQPPLQQFGQQQFLQQPQMQQYAQQQFLQQPQMLGQQFMPQAQMPQMPYGGQQQGLAYQAQGQPIQALHQAQGQGDGPSFQMTPGMFPQRQQPQVVMGQAPPSLAIEGQDVGPAPDPSAIVQPNNTVGAFLNVDSLMSWSNWLASESGRDQNDILTAYLLRFIGNNGKNWRFGPYQVTSATVSGGPVGESPSYVGHGDIASRLSVGQLPVGWTDTTGNMNIQQCATDTSSIRGMVNTLMGLPVNI